jgi:hypothetical protein
MKERQTSTRWLGLVLACGFTTFAVTTQAAKPPKPPPPPPTETSTIYFGHAGGIWRMNPDGSAKTLVCAMLEGAQEAFVASQARHGERRWFLSFRSGSGTYPYVGGEWLWPRRDLFAFSDRGEIVQVTDNPLFQANDMFVGGTEPRWTLGPYGADSRITLVGRRWNAEGTELIEIGLFAIDFDPAILAANIGGNLALQAAWLPIPMSISTVVEDDGYTVYGDVACVGGFDWSPQGDELVFAQDGTLYIFSDDGASSRVLLSDPAQNPRQPRWSPLLADGHTEILFATGITWGSYIATIHPDGAGQKTVVPPYSHQQKIRWDQSITWSPTGAFFLWAEYDSGMGSTKDPDSDIVRVTADGGSKTVLTRDIFRAYPWGWTMP